MAIKQEYGPDRVLMGLAGFLQHKLPAKIAEYNSQESFSGGIIFTIPGGNTIDFSENFELEYQVQKDIKEKLVFPAGTYTVSSISQFINSATDCKFTSVKLGDYSLIFQPKNSGTLKILTGFGNLRPSSTSVSSELRTPVYYQISGVLPGENELKNYPAILINLDSIQVDAAATLQKYNLSLVIAVTSPLSSATMDYLTDILFRYYDVIFELLMVDDDGSIGSIANGVRITSAKISEGRGNANYIKLLNISLQVSVEEDL